MAYKEKIIEKSYFSIGEVAEKFGVTTSLIRFWETEFELIQPKKNRKGNRLFTRKDIQTIETIYHLVKEKGYTLKGAKEVLKSENQNNYTKLEAIEKLKEIRFFLVELKNAL